MTWRAVRDGLLQIHLWVALILCVPMVIIGISGSALLVQREYLARAIPSATATGPRQTIPRIVAAAEAAAPAGMTAHHIWLPMSEGEVSWVRFQPAEQGSELDIYVDPVSLRVLGSMEVIDRGPVLAFLIGVHAFLTMPPPIGLPFVGWNGVAMTFMGLSGLILWWPRRGQWRRSFSIRRGARGLAFHFDLHRMVGIWGLLVFLAVNISGVYLTFPQTLGPLVRSYLPAVGKTTAPQPGYVAAKGPIGPEEAIALARSAVPDVRVAGLELARGGDAFVVDLQPQGFRPSQPNASLVIDPKTAEITYIDDPRDYSFPEKLLNVQHLLHFGVGLGWVWTILVFLSGLLPLLFAITGLTMWWKKKRGH